jgi:4-hydroxy-3-methylbut-2-en-1-yl diphosphate reductase
MPEAPALLAATRVERNALRRELPGAVVTRTGMAFSHRGPSQTNGPAIIAGLAGGLAPHLQPGTVVIPGEVALPDGRRFRCNPAWTERLISAARSLGYTVERGPLLTADRLITGSARDEWSAHGFVAADMETGHLMAACPHVATVRVVLDTPSHPIAGDWQHPARALCRPSLWSEAIWMARHAPAFARHAARIVRRALEETA